MKATMELVLRLNEMEMQALKRLLGSMTRNWYTQINLSESEQNALGEIYDAIPE